jgi:hypothetical protein
MESTVLKETLIVSSTAIFEATYYNRICRLFITFRTGKEYEYFDVPEHVMTGLRSANSKGEFINKFITRHYHFRQVFAIYSTSND